MRQRVGIGSILYTAHAGKNCCTSDTRITQRRIYRPVGHEPKKTERERQIDCLSCGQRGQAFGSGLQRLARLFRYQSFMFA